MLIQECIDFETWEDFVAHVRVLFKDANKTFREKYWFRGQGNSEWALTPNFDRLYTPSKGKRKQKVYEELVLEFIKHSEEHDLLAKLANESEDQYRLRSTILAQHHGLPTRLLDWTDTPFIATWFAFRSSSPSSEKVAVWMLNREAEVWDKEFGVELIDLPAKANLRMKNQRGKFTLLRSNSNTLEEFCLDSGNQTAKGALCKFTLPTSLRDQVLAWLALYGINASSLFPGLGGIAESVREQVFVGKF
jgi:hypothetical protein